MNAAKLERAERDITTAARKVLDCLGTMSPLSAGEVTGELKRRGVNMDPRVIGGVLDSLKEDGLAREEAPGRFCRVAAKPKLVALPAEAKAEPPPAAPEKPDTLTAIATLAANLRVTAAELNAFADSLDSIAIDVEERVASAAAGSEKLRQLQELLRSIGGG